MASRATIERREPEIPVQKDSDIIVAAARPGETFAPLPIYQPAKYAPCSSSRTT